MPAKVNYNNAVAKANPHGAKRGQAGGVPAKHKVLENIGLIVIIVLILAITITRYWHNIHWSLR